MKSRHFTVSLATLLVAACVALPTRAEVVTPFASEPAPTSFQSVSLPQAGWGFYANSDATGIVDRLGYWAPDTNPGGALMTDHDIGLYHYNGSNYTQIARASVSAESVADSTGYVWAEISPVILSDITQGADYYIVTGTATTDPWGPYIGSGGITTVDSSFGTRTLRGFFNETVAISAGGNVAFTSSPGLNAGYSGPNVGRAIELLSGISVVDFSSEYPGRTAVEAVNGVGLQGGRHNNNFDHMWLNNGGGPTADITFDLGINEDLDSIRVWNYNEMNLPNRGANEVEIWVSSTDDPGDLQKLLSGDTNNNFFFDIATGLNGYTGFMVDLTVATNAQLLDSVRLVQFNILSNHGDADYTGLSEVWFYSEFGLPAVAIPAPAALPAGLSMLGAVAARRRVRR